MNYFAKGKLFQVTKFFHRPIYLPDWKSTKLIPQSVLKVDITTVQLTYFCQF